MLAIGFVIFHTAMMLWSISFMWSALESGKPNMTLFLWAFIGVVCNALAAAMWLNQWKEDHEQSRRTDHNR